jgi:ABC-type transport system involved in cytochrome c biogenesis ATPase subunit/GNAT superfamily N-acetyltransferase
MVGQNDEIVARNGLERRMWVDGEVAFPIHPIFEQYSTHMLAGEEIETRIAEIATDVELKQIEALEAFHYKTLDFSASGGKMAAKKSVGGRRAILILHAKLEGAWKPAGYIELQMPLMMAKPRHVAFDRPFQHPALSVAWETWRKGGQALVNRIARIARVVIHPEFRGASLSGVLVRAAVQFARDRWHIGGKRTLFVEISAEMLRHIDFVSSCGFHYLGDTEGNHARLSKDMRSMKQGRKGGSGIMSLQRKYYASFEAYRESSGESFESLQARLIEILSKENPWSEMDLDEWLALRPLIRSPIPYYMIGLDEYSDAYVKAAAKPRQAVNAVARVAKIGSLKLNDVSVVSNFDVPHTQYSRLVMDAFGLTTRTLRSTLLPPVSFNAQAGTVTFVAGSSGSGKSLLLAALDARWTSETALVAGTIEPSSYSARWLRPLPNDATLFEYMAAKKGPEQAFDVLARVGLSEAMLFLKPYALLSRGQRYRAMLADLMLGDEDVWLIDEFCSDLDPLAARILAHRLRQTVRREGRIAFVAAANHGHFISALRPARVLKLDMGGMSTEVSGGDYIRGISHQAN